MENEQLSIYSIFVFFLIISSNYLGELFPCRIQKVLSNNVYLKHIFGFLTLSFFVVLTDPSKKYNYKKVFRESALLYLIFIIFSKNNFNFFIIGLILLGIIYILNLIKVDLEGNIIENSTKEEQDKNKNLINLIEKIKNILLIIFIINIIIGFILYMGEKKIEYKNNFNYIIFFMGQSKCKDKTPSTNIISSFKAAFT